MKGKEQRRIVTMFAFRNCVTLCTRFHRRLIRSCVIQRLVNRRFRISATLAVKNFTNSENIFAHSILQNNSKCLVLRGEENEVNNTVCNDIVFNRNWNDLSTDDILKHLQMIGSYCNRNGITISDERFDKFVDVCTERCFDFTDDQLTKSLQILIHHPQTSSHRSRNFVELWTAFDDACVHRINQWNYDKMLYICDHWHMLNLGRCNTFNWVAGRTIGKKLRKLPVHQMIQLMFYINLKREPFLEMIDFETNLLRSVDELSLNEISIMCMGFFKTQTKFRIPELITRIFDRLIREIDTVQDIPMVCILKVIATKHLLIPFVQEINRHIAKT